MVVNNVGDIYPLSPMQQGMLFHTLYAPKSGVYLEQLSWIIRGNLNILAFRQSWQQIIDEHAILRTMFIWEELKTPLQVVRQDVVLPWEYHDLQKVDPIDQDQQVQAILQADRERGFELGRAPLMRVLLIQLSDDTYQFVWSFHHILLDGWSMSLLLKRLFTCYLGWQKGQKELLVRNRPFRDYISWLQNQDMLAAENFWRRVLKGFTAPTPLPANGMADPTVSQSSAYEQQHIQFSVEIATSLRALARQHQLTLNTIIQASWGLLLSKYSGEKDVIFGVTSSGRPTNLNGIESMVGLFINTLPMRVQVAPESSLLQWLASVQMKQAATTQYEYPSLIQVQGWSEIRAGLSLFESILVFENYPTHISQAELSIDLEIFDGTIYEQTNYPLTVVIDPRSSLRLQITYDVSRFQASVITGMLAHWEELLKGFLSNPRQRIGSLSFSTEKERSLLLQEWNATTQDFPRDRCLPELFEEQVARTPDAIALVDGEQQISYSCLNERVNQLARHLHRQGVGPEVKVGLYLKRSLEQVVGLFAVLKAGGAYVPLDLTNPSERLRYMVHDAQVRYVLTRAALLNQWSMSELSTVEIICLEAELWQEARQLVDTDLTHATTSENLAYLIYTSGSTGQPKGVAIQHRGLINYVCWCIRTYGVKQKEWQEVPIHSSLSFDLTITGLFPSLLVGKTVVLLQEDRALDALGTALQVRSSFSLIKITPAHIDVLSQLLMPQPVMARTGALIIGGEALYGEQLTFWRTHMPYTRLINEYGPTETVVGCCIYEVPEGEIVSGPVPIGKPIMNTQAYVLDEYLQLQPLGVPGELYIGGEGVARGYHNRPDLTAEKFVPDPFSQHPGRRLYRTGDLGRYRADGVLEFLGRLDQQVKLHGYRIELGEIESVLLQHPLVREAATTLQSSKGLVAYIVSDASDPDAQEHISLTALLDERIGYWQMVFDQSYDRPLSPQDDKMFDLAGWNSSYTGSPVPAVEMKEWVDHSVENVLRCHPQRILEIGCGTGLLLFRIAPHCLYYYGTDFSRTALMHLQQQVQRSGLEKQQVVLEQRNADDFLGIAEETFDTVILNSVVQYFPNIDYLVTVLTRALEVVTLPGRIFIGDVRSHYLSQAFYTSVELHQAAPSLSIERLQQHIHKRVSQEQELLIDPMFFYALQQQFPQISSVDLRPKRGRNYNELTCFRYDVVLHLDPAKGVAKTLSWLDWRQDSYSITTIRRILLEQEPEYLALMYVANKRLLKENRALALLNNSGDLKTVGDLRYRLQMDTSEDDALDPEDLWALPVDLPYSVEISWASAHEDGSYEVVFTRHGAGEIQSAEPVTCLTPEIVATSSWQTYANDPLHDRLTRRLTSNLRSYIQTRLPEYMVPSNFVFLEAMPLTHNGKVDYHALPLPRGGLRVEKSAPYISPQTEMEQILVAIWREVLQVEDEIGIHDNFFELGGHSLLMVQMYSKLHESVSKEVSLVDLFKYPTIQALAKYLSQEQDDPSVLPQGHDRASIRKEAMKQQQHRQRYRAMRSMK